MKKQSVTITGENLNVVVNNANEAAIPVSGARMMSKAEMRIAALKAKGIDTSCYFPMGAEQLVKIEDGKAIPIDLTDEVEKKMVDGGYINHYSLFRRWVMSQMFHNLRKIEKDDTNMTQIIKDHGYEYSWRVVENELLAQAKMVKHGDIENYKMRNLWFNKDVVKTMASEYVSLFKSFVETELMYRLNKRGERVFRHKCKDLPYVRLSGENVFVSDLYKKVYRPLDFAVARIRFSESAEELYTAVVKFNSLRKKMRKNTTMCDAFINAYKGSGAYFTMRNLIMFHGASFKIDGDILMGKEDSLVYLDKKADSYKDEGWRMIGVMKHLIEESNISVQGKIDEWR